MTQDQIPLDQATPDQLRAAIVQFQQLLQKIAAMQGGAVMVELAQEKLNSENLAAQLRQQSEQNAQLARQMEELSAKISAVEPASVAATIPA